MTKPIALSLGVTLAVAATLAGAAPAGAQSAAPAWTCAAPTGPLPTDNVGRSRSEQLETTTTFSADGRKATVALDRRHTGRTVWGYRADRGAATETAASCAAGQAGAALFDQAVEPGKIYEYKLRTTSAQTALVGAQLPAVHDRGRVLVVVESGLVATSSVDVAVRMYIESLRADGWDAVRLDVSRTAAVASVRAQVRAFYDEDRATGKAAVLIGHVPVPYSGTGAYDGHPEHNGAWATDAPYADVDGAWTDSSVNTTTPARDANDNVPGDGKYDQNAVPSDAELAVGRIDFSNLPAVGKTEAQLTIDYLDRDGRYRRGELGFRPEAYTTENFGFVPAGYLHNVSPVVGGANVRVAQTRAQVDAATTDGRPFLLAYAAGGGTYSSSNGVGSTTNPPPALFLGTLGSYYGDWDSQNNFLRGHLTKGLGALWENWAVDGLALGQTVGETVRRNVNLRRWDLRDRLSSYLGDPTLRAYPLRGAEWLTVSEDASDVDTTGCKINLSWPAVTDPAVTGLHVDRRVDGGPIERLTDEPLNPAVVSFRDPQGLDPNGPLVEYLLRPVREQVTSRGSFTNLGQGARAEGWYGRCD